jgi:hypothetical protein
MITNNTEEEYSPYCKICTNCGEEGCCSPVHCSMDKDGSYCESYLKDLKYGYLMHQDLYNLISKDEKYTEELEKIFNKNYDIIYKNNINI